jgi:putative hydrolase of HD superfamily
MAKESELESLAAFFHLAGKLKLEKRRGWLDRGVKEAESVADHSFRLALMSLVFSQRQGLDACRAVKLAIVHDLPEAICGDIAVRVKEEMQKVSNKEKKRLEENALEQEMKMLPAEIAREIKGLWEEYEARETKEAKLVYELDRLEAIFQAVEYEKAGNFRVGLQEFYDYANARIENPELRDVFGLLMEERDNGKPVKALGEGMEKNVLAIDILKPVDFVFRFTLDPANTPKWIPSVLEEKTSEPDVKAGTLYFQKVKTGKKGTEQAVLVVTGFIENEMVIFHLLNGRYSCSYRYEPISSGGTRRAYSEENGVGGKIESPMGIGNLQMLKRLIEES